MQVNYKGPSLANERPCALGRIRTLNPRSRNPIFYPVELRVQYSQLLLLISEPSILGAEI
jgi:hypothetical protein